MILCLGSCDIRIETGCLSAHRRTLCFGPLSPHTSVTVTDSQAPSDRTNHPARATFRGP